MFSLLKFYESKQTGVKFQISKRKGKVFIKVYLSIREFVFFRNDYIVVFGFEEEGCRWKIELDGIAEIKLSDKSELTVNYKIVF